MQGQNPVGFMGNAQIAFPYFDYKVYTICHRQIQKGF